MPCKRGVFCYRFSVSPFTAFPPYGSFYALFYRRKNEPESVRHFFAEHAPDIDIIEMPESTATVELAARVHGVTPGQIAKTLSLKVKESVVLIVTRRRPAG